MSNGFGDAIRKLEQLEERARNLDGTHSVPVNQLFSAAFMRRYTGFSSFQAMLEASGFKVESEEHFRAIPDLDWDNFVRSQTRFPSWEAMQKRAAQEWVTNQLRL